jgi:DNA adenine methylase
VVAPRPFLRWAGGKQWFADDLIEEILRVEPLSYTEPFLGAGSIALAMPNTIPLHLSDWSVPLINAWQSIVKHPKVVASLIIDIARKYGNEAEGYLAARALFNQHDAHGVRAAALMLFLNARCYNGLWRENKKGYFNTPFGKLRSPRSYPPEELIALSAHLQRATITQASFQGPINSIDAGGAIYADPPYHNGYTSYTAGGFSDDMQRSLATCLRLADSRGSYVWSTNSDTELIRELYSWADLSVLEEPRAIAANPDSRKPAPCLLIRGQTVKRRLAEVCQADPDTAEG